MVSPSRASVRAASSSHPRALRRKKQIRSSASMAMRTAASKMAGALGLRVQSNGGAFQRLMATGTYGAQGNDRHNGSWNRPHGMAMDPSPLVMMRTTSYFNIAAKSGTPIATRLWIFRAVRSFSKADKRGSEIVERTKADHDGHATCCGFRLR